MRQYIYTPPSDPIPILHADGQVLAVDKPAGLLTVPGKGEDKQDCLINRLRADFPGIRLVHRLDTDTSGVVCFALTHEAQANLGQQFEKRKTDKTYVARVWGRMEQDAGRVDLPLIVDWPNRPRQHVNFDTGKPAQTDWQVLERLGNETRVALMPLTGRSHQLRVHMAELGHPILGDDLYSEGPARAFPRMMLHAERLVVHQPGTGQKLEFHAPAPF
jgi:tRNA pseudouridine32 synthase/23S rRNA pseudouridine746 synthase